VKQMAAEGLYVRKYPSYYGTIYKNNKLDRKVAVFSKRNNEIRIWKLKIEKKNFGTGTSVESRSLQKCIR
jgi:hypothetical protein